MRPNFSSGSGGEDLSEAFNQVGSAMRGFGDLISSNKAKLQEFHDILHRSTSQLANSPIGGQKKAADKPFGSDEAAAATKKLEAPINQTVALIFKLNDPLKAAGEGMQKFGEHLKAMLESALPANLLEGIFTATAALHMRLQQKISAVKTANRPSFRAS